MRKTLVIILGVWLLLVGKVGAHGDGASFEHNISGFLVDIGYEPAEFKVGESHVFDFNISKDEKPVDYDQVWVRVLKDQKTYLATGIKKSDLGKTSLVYVFPEAGDYHLIASFRKVDAVVAEDDIPITVALTETKKTSSPTGNLNSIIGFVAVGVLGFGLGALFFRRK